MKAHAWVNDFLEWIANSGAVLHVRINVVSVRWTEAKHVASVNPGRAEFREECACETTTA